MLLTHSMGGQIAYDVVTSFLPAARSNIKVDFWCATASQVGYFEELNMFIASSTTISKATGRRTPVANANLDDWWNVWDRNDIISFTTRGIFADGIDDEEYWSGTSLAAAHGGYLERPSFYRRFAGKLRRPFRRAGADMPLEPDCRPSRDFGSTRIVRPTARAVHALIIGVSRYDYLEWGLRAGARDLRARATQRLGFDRLPILRVVTQRICAERLAGCARAAVNVAAAQRRRQVHRGRIARRLRSRDLRPRARGNLRQLPACN